MSDMIDRDAAAAICDKHSYSNNQYVSMRMIDAAKEIRALPAVEVGVTHLSFDQREPSFHAAGCVFGMYYIFESDVMIDPFKLERPGWLGIIGFPTLEAAKAAAQADYDARIRSALTVTPAPDVVEIDLRAVSMEEIEKAAGQSPWVPPEYTMNEIVSDCCSFLREPRESAPDAGKVQALVDALEFYADRDNYEPVYERMPCDCCTDIYEPVKRDEGDTARAALAAWKEGK